MNTVKVTTDIEFIISAHEQKVLDRLTGLYGEELVDGVIADLISMMLREKFEAEGADMLIADVASMCEAYGEVENA